SGRRVSKTRFRKACISDKADGVYAADWERELVTHYTGIGTEVRESFHNGTPSETKVVVNMPQGLGRYMPEDASAPVVPSTTLDENGKPTDWSVFNPKFEWYLKNHLGSTMLVYGTQSSSNTDIADLGEVKAAYDYRAFGEQVSLTEPTDKVTENFTGKEKDDETDLNYFGARYLDPMLGLWISVDPARQFSSPYLYVGNGYNPIGAIDPDGEAPYQIAVFLTNGEIKKDENDYHEVERVGRNAFGNDFDIKVIQNQKEMIRFVKDGRYTAIVSHTWNNKGELRAATKSPAAKLSLFALDKNLKGTSSFAKAFACHTGEWGDLSLENVDYGDNMNSLPIGDAYKEAMQYIVDGFKMDNDIPVEYNGTGLDE
ncbi:MAG: RHS repeat-associated core domain-containing protein, partial [Fibrobacter sp.]|nr:RHS repeat-associated core domain-containing protein [Fibrobacter sp.]